MPQELAHIYEESENDDDEGKDELNGPKNYLKEIEFEYPELASYSELFW